MKSFIKFNFGDIVTHEHPFDEKEEHVDNDIYVISLSLKKWLPFSGINVISNLSVPSKFYGRNGDNFTLYRIQKFDNVWHRKNWAVIIALRYNGKVNSSPEVCVSMRFVDVVLKPQMFKPGEIWGFGIPVSQLASTCCLSITFFGGNSGKERNESKLCPSDLSTQFRRPYDVVLEGTDFKLHAHKDILSQVSPVFSALFLSCTTESSENRVEIPDIDQEVLEVLLKLLYRSKAYDEQDLQIYLDKLFVLSCKYCIDDLRVNCETAMLSSVSRENVVGRLILAYLHDSPVVREKCLTWIRESGSILTDQDWSNLLETPNLLLEVTKTLSTLAVKTK